MTIDERLKKISQQLEIITGLQYAAELRMEDHERLMAQQEARERQGREALLAGIAAYLRALGGNQQ